MNTITKNQETLPPQLFAELKEKARMFGVSLAEYIHYSVMQTKRKISHEYDDAPFSKNIPNKETIKAMQEAEAGKTYKFKDLKDLQRKLRTP